MYTSKQTAQLTPRQLELLRLVGQYRANCCYSASMQELASSLGISRTTAFEHIAALRRKNLLSAAPGKARSLSPTAQGRSLLKSLKSASAVERDAVDGVPLLAERKIVRRAIDQRPRLNQFQNLPKALLLLPHRRIRAADQVNDFIVPAAN